MSFNFLKPKSKKSKPKPQTRKEPKLSSDMRYKSYEEDDDEEEFEEKPKKQVKKPKKLSLAAKIRRWLFSFFIRIFILASVVIGSYIGYLYLTLPDISKLGEFKKTPSIIVKSEDGIVIGTYGDVYGDYVPYGQLPKHLIDAVVSTEDRNFFNHFGIDIRGLLRAIYTNIKARKMLQGGSTITQQVAKNVFLTPERKLKRKLQEMLLALKLENRYSKQEILTIYMNRVYMGAGNYGVDSAAKRYFGHSVREITLSEAAILVGLLKAPSRYAPTNNPDLSEKRATQVLLNMKDAGYIKQAQLDDAKSNFNDEDSSYRDSHSYGSFYFSDWVVGQLAQLPEYVGYSKEDVIVTTTLKPEWQHFAEDAVSNVLAEKDKALRASQAALLSMTPDGAIRAMVGGRNYRSSQFNRATQGMRQPGSSFKLFVYLAALEAGFLPDSEMVDQAINIGKWHIEYLV
ncbi:MAG: transglycosylase domain-containing protein [Pseudomonadota bacterium]